MATIVLQAVGTAVGGAIAGPVGAAIGGAIGGAVGYQIDQSIFSKDRVVTGPRLEQARMLSSSHGAAIPRVYGRARIGGQIIWATRFEEIASTRKQGGKGGGSSTKVTEYAYFANLAVGICEGPITAIRRIWADGTELDLTKLELRLYKGTSDQQPDGLIEAKQGIGNTPAYRGTAYVVLEGFPLDSFGNRIPQLTFEVVRSVNALDHKIRAMTVIPGSTEYGYAPQDRTVSANGEVVASNRHNQLAQSDWQASIDELQALCPNLETVSLIVSWFGTDLRAGHCRIEPRVEPNSPTAATWNVAGIDRSKANAVSLYEGAPAYGGTPDDQSVIDAIADLRQRGLKVVLYPFVMMDIPHGNTLPGLDGSPSQPPYPWRGEISSNLDQSNGVRSEIANFVGTAESAAFQPTTGTILFNAEPQWSYRRLVLHYAHLCQMAGGIDGFIIGSELRRLTRLRDADNAFPFVDSLVELASDVRGVLGEGPDITYAADWTEYFGYHPQDGSNDIHFNLDPLWMSPSITAIGIDNYMPLADWRAGGDPEQPLVKSPYDRDYLKQNIRGGEGFDWYYADEGDRRSADRLPISDGQGEQWVWRVKDLANWWLSPHHNRINGVRSVNPTQWQPGAKPVWFTELGCPAVDKGANQPNLFPDPKSSTTKPYYSNGARDDLIQNRFLEAHLDFWAQAGTEANPLSPVNGQPMLEPSNIHMWTWDARPFPAFPQRSELWSDGENWHTGHWLNGRLGGCSLEDLLNEILEDYGIADAEIRVDGYLDGYVISDTVSPRVALEPLIAAFGLVSVHKSKVVADGASILSLRSRGYLATTDIEETLLVDRGRDAAVSTRLRTEDGELPAEVIVQHHDMFSGYDAAVSSSRRLEGLSRRQVRLDLPAIMPATTATALAEQFLKSAWQGRQQRSIALPAHLPAIRCGDLLRFVDGTNQDTSEDLWLVDELGTGLFKEVRLKAFSQQLVAGGPPDTAISLNAPSISLGSPHVLLLDIPDPGSRPAPRLLAAVHAKPWAQEYAIFSSPSDSGFQLRSTSRRHATTGKLLAPISAGFEGRWQRDAGLHISLQVGALSSEERLAVLNGANIIAVKCLNQEWELIQFQTADLLEDGSWMLDGLLRGQGGSTPAMRAGAAIGSDVVVLDGGLHEIEISPDEIGVELNWRTGPSSRSVGDSLFEQQKVTLLDLAARPLSPVHLKISTTPDNNTKLTWTRRSRVNADTWSLDDVPLGEETERYRVELVDGAGQVLRTEDTTSPTHEYPMQELQAAFLGATAPFECRVRQIGTGGRAGSPASISITN